MTHKKTIARALTETKGDVLVKGVNLKKREHFKRIHKAELKSRGLDMNDYWVKAINFAVKHPEVILGS